MKSNSQRGFPSYALRAISMSFCKQAFSKQGPAYLKFMGRVVLRKPWLFPEAMRLAIMGYHYEKITAQQIMVDDFRELLVRERSTLKEMLVRAAAVGGSRVADVQGRLQEVQGRLQESYARIRSRYRDIHEDFRSTADSALQNFRTSLESHLLQLSEQFQLQFELPAL